MPGPFCLVPVVGVLVVYGGELVVGWSARKAPTELRLIFNYFCGGFLTALVLAYYHGAATDLVFQDLWVRKSDPHYIQSMRRYALWQQST